MSRHQEQALCKKRRTPHLVFTPVSLLSQLNGYTIMKNCVLYDDKKLYDKS